MKKSIFIKIELILYAVILFLFTLSCSDSTSPANNNHKSSLLKIGEFTTVVEGSIGNAGGQVVVDNGDSLLNGLTISALDGALSKTIKFKVSEAPIISHSFGNRFHPITPVIKIENGGGYSDGPIFVEIPINISEDEIPAAFFYDDNSGMLEPIPVLKFTKENIVIASRHFATSEMYVDPALGKQVLIQSDDLYSNIVISSVKKSDLTKAGIISSGFLPGKDDWEFPNMGSYVEPEGNCSGHSISELWYYVIKKPSTNKNLYGQFDKTKSPFWQDNPLGVRMATKTQNEEGKYWQKIYFDFFEENAQIYDRGNDFYNEYHKVAWDAAAAQMYVSGQPMYTLMSPNDGSSGHAVVTYKIDYNGGKIYLADPNFPANTERVIIKSGDVLQAYQSGDNANDTDAVSFTKFACFGMSAMYNWNMMAVRWTALENGTIGNDIFPNVEYTLKSHDGESELGDVIPFDSKNDYAIACKVTPKNGQSFDGGVAIYNGDMNIGMTEDDKWAVFSMTEDDNNKMLGIWVWKMNNGVKKWIDFKWVSVTELKIEPDVLNGEKNVEYEWEAVIANPPSNARYEWNFGDGSNSVIVKNNKKVSHTYKENGIYPVVLELFDDANGNFAGVATAYANIGAGLIDTSYKNDLYWGYPIEENPRFNITINGIINAEELKLLSIYSPTTSMPLMYIYKAKSGSNFNIELNLDFEFIKKKIIWKTGYHYGIYKYEWEFESVHDNLNSFINDGSSDLSNINITKIDSSGKRFILKGTVPAGQDVNLSLIVYGKYKYLETEYYRENDGTESKNIFDDDGMHPMIAVSIQFKK